MTMNVKNLKDIALKMIDSHRNGDWNVVLQMQKEIPSGFPCGELIHELPDGRKTILVGVLDILKWVNKVEMEVFLKEIPGYNGFSEFDI